MDTPGVEASSRTRRWVNRRWLEKPVIGGLLQWLGAHLP
jgi:hypothetical protein